MATRRIASRTTKRLLEVGYCCQVSVRRRTDTSWLPESGLVIRSFRRSKVGFLTTREERLPGIWATPDP